MNTAIDTLLALSCTLALASTLQAQSYRMTTEIAPEITTPSSVETGIGTLKFFDGFRNDETIRLVYDNLDRQRAVEVFLDTIPAASLVAMRHGLREVGAVDGTVGVWENL